jgi:integral membrane protein
MDTGGRIINKFKKAARAEGISFLVLLLIAMPLKYMAGMPMAVKITGWAHGMLFIWYWVAAVPLFTVLRWPLDRVIGMGLASILPFGTFVMEHKWLSPRSGEAGGLTGN